MPTSDAPKIHQMLAQVLETTDHSQRQLAKSAGIDPGQLSRFFQSQAGLSEDALGRLADVLQSVVAATKTGQVIPKETLHQLACDLRDGRLVLFVGAGISRQAIPPKGLGPLPLWGELAKRMVSQLTDADTAARLAKRPPLEQLDYLQAGQQRGRMVEKLREILDASNYALSDTHKALAALPWRHVITTNYDDLLGQALRVRNPAADEADFLNTPAGKPIPLVHLNGNLGTPHTLTSRDLEAWAEMRPQALNFLRNAVCPPNRCLFIGYSFSDPFLRETLGRVKRFSTQYDRNQVSYAWMWHLDEMDRIILKDLYNIEALAIQHDDEWLRAFTELEAAYHQLCPPSAGAKTVRSIELAPPATAEQRRQHLSLQRRLYAQANLSALYVGPSFANEDIQLKAVYVQPSLCPSESMTPALKAQRDTMTRGLRELREEELRTGAHGCRSAEDWLKDEECRSAVLLGGPGMGKSSLLQSLLMDKLTAWADAPQAHPFAVFLRLSVWESDCGKGESLPVYARRILAQELTIDPDSLLPWFTGGPVHWLLDGIDEVRALERREALIAELETLRTERADDRWVVTSRPSGYKEAKLAQSNWKHLDLAPLDNEQGLKLLDNWSGILGKLSQINFDAEDLFTTLGDQPGLSPLRRNPLLLTMIVQFYRDNYRIPDDRWEFYDHATTTLRLKWVRHRAGLRAREAGNAVEMRYIRSLLPFVAIESMKAGTAVLSKRQLEDMLAPVLRADGFTLSEAKEESVRFFNDVVGLIGVLVEKGQDRYGYLHLTFQEFYAALWLVNHPADAMRLLPIHGLHPDWKEVWDLYILGLSINGEQLDQAHSALGGSDEAMVQRLRWLGLGTAAIPEDKAKARRATLDWGLAKVAEPMKGKKQGDSGNKTLAQQVLESFAAWERSYSPEVRERFATMLAAGDAGECHTVARALGEQATGRELRHQLLGYLCGENARLRDYGELALASKADSPVVAKALATVAGGVLPEGVPGTVGEAARIAAVRALGGRVSALKLRPAAPLGSIVVKLSAGVDMMFVPIRVAALRGREQELTQGHPIAVDYWLGQTLVTQAQWMALAGDAENPSYWKQEHLPVEQIDCAMAEAFAARVKDRLDPELRKKFDVVLPTEWEWEYACRAGIATKFYTGNFLGKDDANFDASGDGGISRGQTTVVAGFPANPWGLYDMHGNVWEWTSSYHDEEGRDRVDRGGSFAGGAGNCAAGFRDRDFPAYRGRFLGFRLALRSVQ